MALPVDTTSDAEPPNSSLSSRATSPSPLPQYEEQPTNSHHPSRGRGRTKKKSFFRGTPQWAKTLEHPVMFSACAPVGIESENLNQDDGTSVPATTPSVELRRSGRERTQRLCYNPVTSESTRPIAVSYDP